MRLMLGNVRADTPRGALKAAAHVHAERLARRAINAALDPSADPIRAGSLALRVIETVDPASEATVEIRADLRPEDIEGLSWSELLAVAEQCGIPLPEPDAAPPAGLPRAATGAEEPLNHAI